MNPAVTLAVFIATGAMRWFQAVAYVLLQLVGGTVGAALTRVSCT
jgi:glycerol uptake facilitator-like aquaporin